MAQLRAYRDDGILLFDTNLISYGLSKSGYMTAIQSWSRRTLLSANLDPNNGANYSPVVVSTGHVANSDPLWGFTVIGAVSPVIFITGSGCLVGTSISGNSTTFLYTNASVNTKFYCFDLMVDSIGNPYLKTYNTSGVLTFNSLMPPINVITAVTPPSPANLDVYGRYTSVYAGSTTRRVTSSYSVPNVASEVNIPLTPGVDYAAHLTFSRTATVWDTQPNSPATGPVTVYSASEGASGYVGGVRFQMAATAGGSQIQPNTNQASVPASWVNIPVDRIPVALVINTAGYPFPFN